MLHAESLSQGRAAFDARAWGDACAAFAAADRDAALQPADLERFAIAARLTGRDALSGDLMARAHQGWLATAWAFQHDLLQRST